MNKTIIHFDIESTGISTTKDRIIQLSLIKTECISNIIDKKKLLFNNDGVPIHPEAVAAHGITESFIKDCPKFSQYALKIFNYINDCDFIAGYNIKQFDIPLLMEEFGRNGLVWIPKPAIDSCVIFKKREERTLTAAYKFYCNKLLKGAHDAENDVIASIEVLDGQSFTYGISFEELLMESCYKNEDRKLDFAGKIIKNEDGIPVWSFGKNENRPVLSDRGYCDWVLGADFSFNTKQVLRDLLQTKNK